MSAPLIISCSNHNSQPLWSAILNLCPYTEPASSVGFTDGFPSLDCSSLGVFVVFLGLFYPSVRDPSQFLHFAFTFFRFCLVGIIDLLSFFSHF